MPKRPAPAAKKPSPVKKRAPAAEKRAAAAKKPVRAEKKPARPLTPLTGKQRSHLRALAHPLKPVVQIGRQGLTPGVLDALRAAFQRHELLKVKLAGDAELEAAELAPQIERETRSQVAQIIGHTLVVYRRHESTPKIVLPRPKKAAPAVALSRTAREREPAAGEAAAAEAEEDEEAVEDA